MNKFKAILTSIFAALSSIIGILAIPVLLLVVCNVIDYITGIMAAGSRKQAVSSYKSLKGIVKKVCQWLLVVVGAIIDTLLSYASDTIGLNIPFVFLVACVVAIWLICNELLSILENISDIGVALPSFLKKLVVFIKKQAEGKAELPETDGDANDKR